MRTRVEIAPFERWCAPAREAYLRYSSGIPAPIGEGVVIETTSMRRLNDPRLCGGRAWDLIELPPNTDARNMLTGEETVRGIICEHVLEID